MPDMSSAIIDALLRGFGESLSAMTGEAARVMPAVGASRADWRVSIQVGGRAAGSLSFGISQEGALALVGCVLGDPSIVEPADIVDTLKELLNQSAGTYVNGDGKGLSIDVAAPDRATVSVPEDARRFDVLCGTIDPVRVAVWGQVTSVAADAAPMTAAAAPSASSPAAPASAATHAAPRNLDVLLDIDLPITVRFGETAMTLENLARLSPGSMIDLDRSPDEPVDLLVNGHLIARGQVVVVSSCYGLRVTEVMSPADRLRSLEL